MRWEGHVTCVGNRTGAYRILVGKPEGKRPFPRPRGICKNNAKMDLQEKGWGRGMNCLRKVAGGGLLWTRWWTFWLLMGNFFISWGTISFYRNLFLRVNSLVTCFISIKLQSRLGNKAKQTIQNELRIPPCAVKSVTLKLTQFRNRLRYTDQPQAAVTLKAQLLKVDGSEACTNEMKRSLHGWTKPQAYFILRTGRLSLSVEGYSTYVALVLRIPEHCTRICYFIWEEVTITKYKIFITVSSAN